MSDRAINISMFVVAMLLLWLILPDRHHHQSDIDPCPPSAWRGAC